MSNPTNHYFTFIWIFLDSLYCMISLTLIIILNVLQNVLLNNLFIPRYHYVLSHGLVIVKCKSFNTDNLSATCFPPTIQFVSMSANTVLPSFLHKLFVDIGFDNNNHHIVYWHTLYMLLYNVWLMGKKRSLQEIVWRRQLPKDWTIVLYQSISANWILSGHTSLPRHIIRLVIHKVNKS